VRSFSFSQWLTESGSAGLKASASQGYQRIAWVYACVNIIATTAASASLYFYKGIEQEARNRITDPNHPVNQLFLSPKEPEIPSLRELLNRTFSYLGITGEVFWVFTRKRGQLTVLEAKVGLKPIFAKGTRSTLLGWKERTSEGKIKTYTKDQVLPIMYFNPGDEYSGLSPLSAARLSVEAELNITGWNSSFFKTGMKNPLLLQAKGTLTKDQKSEIKKEITNYYSGIEGGHGAVLLQGNIEVTPLNMSPKDVDFIMGKKLNREEICSIYGVPPALVGIFEYANYSNVREQRKIFWENTLLPRMEKIADLIQSIILNKEFPGVSCAWDTSQMLGLKGDPIELAKAAKEYHAMGYDAKQISVILNAPELDMFYNPKGEEDSLVDPAKPPALEPEKPDEEDEEVQEESAANMFEKKKDVGKWLTFYGNIDQIEVDKAVSKLEKNVRVYTERLDSAMNKGIKLNSNRWTDLWQDTIGRDLQRTGEEAIRSSLTAMKAVANEGVIEEVTDIKSYINDATQIKLRKVISDYIEESKAMVISMIHGLNEGDSIEWTRFKASTKNLSITLTTGLRELIKFKTYELVGVSKCAWVCRDNKHKVLHGKQVEIGKECFPMILANHPHQKGMSLSDVIGCTCTTVPVEFIAL